MTGSTVPIDNLQANICKLEAEAKLWNNVNDYLTMYTPSVLIPHFKKECGLHYFTFLEGFATNHIEYSAKTVDIWSQLKNLTHAQGDSEESEEEINEEDNNNMLESLRQEFNPEHEGRTESVGGAFIGEDKQE